MNIKQLGFIGIGLLIATALFTFAKLNHASATKVDGTMFQDWKVTCKPADEKAKTPETCLINQQVNSTVDGKQQPVALYQFGYFGPKKELQFIQLLPLGVRLDAGTSIVSSKKLIAPSKYITCTATGCEAAAPISDADLKTLLSNTENAVAFMGIDGQVSNLLLSTKGLSEALHYIK